MYKVQPLRLSTDQFWFKRVQVKLRQSYWFAYIDILNSPNINSWVVNITQNVKFQ